MAGQRYYHVSRSPIPVGQTLYGWNPQPRLLGFLLTTYRSGLIYLETAIHTEMLLADSRNEPPMSGAFKDALQEMLLEAERVDNFADRPSRIGSPQLFRTTSAALTFAREYNRTPAYIHVCQITDGNPFHTYMDWVSGGSKGTKSIAEMVEGKRRYAASYWKGDAHPDAVYPEAIVDGRAQVIELLESLRPHGPSASH